jgi:peptidylprolyl isomerase
MPYLSRLALLLPLLAACAREKPASGSIESASFAPSLEVNLAVSTRMPSGLYYRDLAPGTGPVVAAGQQVSALYTGWLTNGTQFDSNAGSAPFSFRVGAHEVIEGWDQGVVGMRVGGKRQLIIPPALGYGPAGSGPYPRTRFWCSRSRWPRPIPKPLGFPSRPLANRQRIPSRKTRLI